MKKSLAILYGGRSVEHEISIRSAKNVIKAIDTERFEIILLGISKGGKWFVCQDIDISIEMGSEITLSLSALPKIFNFNSTAVGIDIAFPLLHGTDGEDGAVQGFFKMIGIPVVGSDVTGSAIAIDKILSKQLWQQAGIPTA
ncbi:MAG: D-alanine-D-alanine ligase, partial [Cyclobacteriaceae bacterium]